jgi:methylenetetrahydrofolate dehydrogenase (NADP+)/methenyltetrahydrofolate cyclohydrolase
MAKIIDGTAMAAEIRAEVAQGVKKLQSESGVTPGLAVVLVGDDPASAVYVRGKTKACAEAGIFSETFRVSDKAPQDQVERLVQQLGHDRRFHGILVQLPLPSHMQERAVIAKIPAEKDVDGIGSVTAGRLLHGEDTFVSCTPAGVQQMLVRSGYDPVGKHVVIVGRSNIVGKPLAALLMQKAPGANATVTVVHTGTPDPGRYTRQADIVVAAVGKPNALTADMVREGAVVIDVGINRISDPTKKSGARLVGDVDYEAVAKKAAAITPVPGGVGPMTIAMLLVNTLKSAQRAAAASRGNIR